MTQDYFPENFVKDALSRCVVEVMMREWPQQWLNLLPLILCKKCNTSVLYVLWRLAEDVGIHFKPNNKLRRQEILNMMTTSMPQILGYISETLQSSDHRLSLLALNTLTSYLEWITIEGSLIQFLSHILSSSPSSSETFLLQAKIIASDCLEAILSRRKFKDEETTALQTFFSEENLSSILQVSRICQDNIKVGGSFEFLDLSKRMASLLTNAAKFALNSDVLRDPSNPVMAVLMKENFDLLSHANQSISFTTLSFWKTFTKEPLNVEDGQFIRSYFRILPQLLYKLPDDHDFVINEFDSYEEYETFFFQKRADVLAILRQLTLTKDEVTFDCCLHLLEQLMTNLKSHQNKKQRRKDWEIMACIFESVTIKLPSPGKVIFYVLDYFFKNDEVSVNNS